MPKDETYIIDLCDRILGAKAERQKRFPFLLGDAGKSGRMVGLPVDAYYKDRDLVIEYYERQHDEAIGHFDKPDKITVSGVHRGLQRKLYDERRKTELPKQGISLIVFSVEDFAHDAAKRLKRVPEDETVIRERLRAFIRGGE